MKRFLQFMPAGRFYLAEEYHQDYYKKNPVRYAFYRRTCGRDARLGELWGDKGQGLDGADFRRWVRMARIHR